VRRGWDIPHGLRLEIYAESERNPRVKTIIQDGFVALMRAIEATIERAQDKGQLRGDLNKRDCAHVIGLIWNGIAMHLSADADYDLGYYQRILNDFTQHWRRGR
jgi:hypothetical protein